MREIKFRAYCGLTKTMINDYCVLRDNEFIGYDTTNNTHYIEAIMQSTGLKDKNGVEIYEGDICEIRYLNGEPTVKGVVKWLQTHTHFSLVTRKGTYSIGMTGSIVDGIYIIGDLFTTPWENPELLEAK